MLARNQIDELYIKYKEIIKWEIEELGCNKTELTHLIGRLGEFYCAKYVNGTLAHATNQHGFDVLTENGKTISVKTTAQKSSFVSINRKTHEKANDLMVLQLKNFEIEIVYLGPMKLAVLNSRPWKERFEFDTSNAKRIYTSLLKVNDIIFLEKQENEKLFNENKFNFYFLVVGKRYYLKVETYLHIDNVQKQHYKTDYYTFVENNWVTIEDSSYVGTTIEKNVNWVQIETQKNDRLAHAPYVCGKS